MRCLDLEQLLDKLNKPCEQALDGALGASVRRTNYSVEVEHLLSQILELPGTDFRKVCANYGVDADRLNAQLVKRLDRLKRGNAEAPRYSERLLELVEQAWLIASVDFGCRRIATGHVLCALFADEQYAHFAELTELKGVPMPQAQANLAELTAGSFESDAEAAVSSHDASVGPLAEGARPDADETALGQFTVDLTQQARVGEIDPVQGRDAEVRQIIDILLRRRQNNPILTGEAGVGKTAVVEGFARRVASGDVPTPLKAAAVKTLDLGALEAGASVKGEFERRLKAVIEEVAASPTPIILFIDEAHNLIGAGGQSGQGDAANLLKPALARGQLRTIAATTWAEYKKFFEKDAALSRRFQVVEVAEPDELAAIRMMTGLLPMLEEHHGVTVSTEAVDAAVKLSSRYVSGRQLPDKSVSVLDTTCARIALSQSATPAAVEDATRRVEWLETSLGILRREAETGSDRAESIASTEQELNEAREAADDLNARWDREKQIASEVIQLHNGLRSALEDQEEQSPPDRDELRTQLSDARQRLADLQGERPLVHPMVDGQAVAETIESWTGIPVGRMVADEVQTLLALQSEMQRAIIGQDHALSIIADRVTTARAQMADPRAPIGVFLLCGTSGVGKTETAVTLANLLYGGEQNMTVINMSEFKEEHKVSLLMGSPPGYVGYGEGGVLTEAVRRKPYSVVLLDEIEKAHPGVQEVFFQVFDKGSMRDGEGREVDFRNTLIIMTTNAATDFIMNLCSDADTAPSPDGFVSAVFPELLKAFKPAFLGRTTLVPYYPLSDDVLRVIIGLRLRKVAQRVQDHYQARFEYDDAVVDRIAERCTESDTGARRIEDILKGRVLPGMSRRFLQAVADGESFASVRLGVADDGSFSYSLSDDEN